MKDKAKLKSRISGLVSGKTGYIKFIHHKTGEENYFYSTINSLSGDRLSAFNNEVPSINDLTWARSVFKDIRKKAKVIEDLGDF